MNFGSVFFFFFFFPKFFQGGMKAGIYIEAFQSITMILGLLVIVISTYSTNSENIFQEIMANRNETLLWVLENGFDFFFFFLFFFFF